MYLILASIFFVTLIWGLIVIGGMLFKSRHWRPMVKIYSAWIVLYALFIIFATGPIGKRSPTSSRYKLPWKAGVSRFVSQGNRSFISHRGLHLYAWDFWMPIGTEVLAARAGRVIKVVQNFGGIGIKSNYILVEHGDGTRAMYAHIRTNGAVVKFSEHVEQGQLIAYSGMVGQTVNPHLHFVVFNNSETESIPITFSDVSGGVPLAGHFYASGNLLASAPE